MGEINLYNKWGEEKALRHGLGCQEEPISLTNPRLKVSSLLQGKSSGEMAFLFFFFYFSQLPKHFCYAHNSSPQIKKKGSVEVPWGSVWFVSVLNIGPEKVQGAQLTLELPQEEQGSVSWTCHTLVPAHST